MPDKKQSTEPAKKKVAAKLFEDVKPSGSVPASSTSKPVITGHINTIKVDPMVAPMNSKSIKTAEDKSADVTTDSIIDKPKRELKINPISEDMTSGESTETGKDSTEDNAEETVFKSAEPSPEFVSEVDKTNDQEVSEEIENTAAVDAIVDTINTKKDRDEESEKQQIIDNEIKELIDSKKYNVKISDTPSKRNAKLLIVLLFLVILGVGGWYFASGPGQKLWLSEDTDNSNVTNIDTPTTKSTTPTQTAQVPEKLVFSSSDIKLSFAYPKTWKIDVQKDIDNPKFDIITLTTPNLEIDSVTKSSPVVKAGAFLRTKIFIENTKNIKDYASKLTKLTTCTSEDLVVGNLNLKLLYTSSTADSPNVSKVSLGPEVCTPDAKLFGANDQIQLTSKQNTYAVYSEYIFSDEYLQKIGTKTEEAIKLAQSSGIVTSKDSFKSTTSYKDMLDVLKSLKEL